MHILNKMCYMNAFINTFWTALHWHVAHLLTHYMLLKVLNFDKNADQEMLVWLLTLVVLRYSLPDGTDNIRILEVKQNRSTLDTAMICKSLRYNR